MKKYPLINATAIIGVKFGGCGINLANAKINKKINFKNLFIYGFAGSLIFFLVSNFGVWALGSFGVNDLPYEKSLTGLIECYILAIPFFGNTFLSTIIFAYPAIFFYKSLAIRASSR